MAFRQQDLDRLDAVKLKPHIYHLDGEVQLLLKKLSFLDLDYDIPSSSSASSSTAAAAKSSLFATKRGEDSSPAIPVKAAVDAHVVEEEEKVEEEEVVIEEETAEDLAKALDELDFLSEEEQLGLVEDEAVKGQGEKQKEEEEDEGLDLS